MSAWLLLLAVPAAWLIETMIDEDRRAWLLGVLRREPDRFGREIGEGGGDEMRRYLDRVAETSALARGGQAPRASRPDPECYTCSMLGREGEPAGHVHPFEDLAAAERIEQAMNESRWDTRPRRPHRSKALWAMVAAAKARARLPEH